MFDWFMRDEADQPRAPADEEPIILVEVFVTRRAGGEYLARLSIDEQAGWVEHAADDPLTALAGASQAAHESLAARMNAARATRERERPTNDRSRAHP